MAGKSVGPTGSGSRFVGMPARGESSQALLGGGGGVAGAAGGPGAAGRKAVSDDLNNNLDLVQFSGWNDAVLRCSGIVDQDKVERQHRPLCFMSHITTFLDLSHSIPSYHHSTLLHRDHQYSRRFETTLSITPHHVTSNPTSKCIG
jgi:hypothetical protein